MKLIACHINNFGKLSDLNINFNDGVNVINQPNGWGKSTLAAFMKAMLYGFDTKKEPGAFERERKLYKPWHQRSDLSGNQHNQDSENRLHNSGKHSINKALCSGYSFLAKR